MKRFLALLIVLMMFVMCSSSYGMFLVYKVSTSVKGVDDTTVSIPLKAYLVMNFDDDSGEIQDANLILYGKDYDGVKVYVQLNDSDSDDYLDIDAWSMGTGDGYSFIDFWAYGDENPFEFEGYVMGKNKVRDIGATDLWIIASSMKGVFMVFQDMLLDADQDISGMSNISMTLDNTTTKMANGGGWSQDDVSAYITGLLQDKDYTEGTVP